MGKKFTDGCGFCHVELDAQGSCPLHLAAPEMWQLLATMLTWPSHVNMTPLFDVARRLVAEAKP
jgi:hypothetical protein